MTKDEERRAAGASGQPAWEHLEGRAGSGEVTANGGASAALLSWYDRNRRILPWREDPTPYHVWLSEIMLQQTRVEAVKKYYLRFTRVLPDIASLSAAPEDVLLKLWEGLGYYSRVRNLQKAAAVMMEKYGGQMPRTKAELLSLPGIGDYTASAIASIAFGECVPAVDGNLLRIFARMTEYGAGIRTETAKTAARRFFAPLMPQERPGDFNQALMDLGSSVCLPNAAPLCRECPWAEACLAHMHGTESAFPVPEVKKARKISRKTVFVIHYHDKIALRRRPAKGLLAGLYEFPNAEGLLDAEQAAAFVRSLGFEPLRIQPLPPAKHIFTHVEWRMQGMDVLVDETAVLPGEHGAVSAGEGEEKPSAVFMADIAQINEKYSIPSAFEVYRRAAVEG